MNDVHRNLRLRIDAENMIALAARLDEQAERLDVDAPAARDLREYADTLHSRAQDAYDEIARSRASH